MTTKNKNIMKRLGLLFVLMITLVNLSCEGPTGPPGPPGLDGLDGINILGQVYEIVGDFTPGNNYTIFTDFALDGPVEVFETDVVLVYILWEVTQDGLDVWRLLPQTRLLDQGILQYNYDFTFFDATIFLETDFDPAFLGPADTIDQVFRIAILPADGAGLDGLDVSNMNEVMDYLNRDEASVRRFELD